MVDVSIFTLLTPRYCYRCVGRIASYLHIDNFDFGVRLIASIDQLGKIIVSVWQSHLALRKVPWK